MTSCEGLIGSGTSFSIGLHDPAEFADRPAEDLGRSIGGSTDAGELGCLSCPRSLCVGDAFVVPLDGDFPGHNGTVE
ncbi:hypothetical protein EV651_1015 [Kribbella sp. VKM Ac-2571]|uniref:hypothetical protein n=1 Tax=Kribbella sp. VKM Ac-2571 TaxID=2512222 RepID=UPI00105DED20|nr:hypothetical protein [Kribbella sp. VKM Ac-2571]TDO68971.1 hypothetical protein EV651_1015 [Kribbella sp. VKM Ac-2571]